MDEADPNYPAIEVNHYCDVCLTNTTVSYLSGPQAELAVEQMTKQHQHSADDRRIAYRLETERLRALR